MLYLGIETSCDDTALALVRAGKCVHAVAASQEQVHALFGGVVPEVASREHYRLLGSLFDRLLAEAQITPQDIAGIAVSRGPGLLGSLLVGVSFAKALALALAVPIIGINHLHAHILVAGLEQEIVFPALALLVSGGHTHCYRVQSPQEFILLGKTLDDAAGEAFDKVGKLLGLPYPAGRIMDSLAQKGQVDTRLLPRPYIRNESLDFSFSGLKTAAAQFLEKHLALRCQVQLEAGEERVLLPEGEALVALHNFCASFAWTVADTLRIKFTRALEQEQAGGSRIHSFVLAGGVAANSTVRATFANIAAQYALPLCVPSPALCTDNGVMVAYAGELFLQQGYYHSLDFATIPRGQKIPDDILHSAS